MRARNSYFVIWTWTRLLLFAVVLIAGATAQGKSLEAALSSLQVLDDQYFLDGSTQTLRDFARQYGSVYHDSLKPAVDPDHLGMLDDRNLAGLFDALLAHALYSESAAAVDDAQSVFPEIVKRNLDSRQRVESFHNVCMLTHRFRFAGILSKKYPEARLQSPPRIIQSPQVGKTARILDVSVGSNSLRVITPAWTHGPKITMLFSPDCGPSLRAVSFIESKPSLRAHFEARSMLIAPPQFDFKVPGCRHLEFHASSTPELHCILYLGLAPVRASHDADVLFCERWGGSPALFRLDESLRR